MKKIPILLFILPAAALLLSGCATPLEKAARGGNTAEVRRLLDTEADLKTDVPSAFLGAVANDHIETVQLLLDRGASVTTKNAQGDSALRLAVAVGDINLVRLLLDKGADVNALNNNGRTALTKATEVDKNRLEIARLLVDRGADVNLCPTDGYTPLICAADGSAEIVRLFLAHGANVQAQATGDQTTALHEAAEHNRFEIVKLLVEHGAVVDAKTKNGITPMMLSVGVARSTEIAKYLLDHGADIDARSVDWQQTALQYVEADNNAEMVKFLLENGADVNVRNKMGTTPLMGANQAGFTTVAGLIAGASPVWREQMLARRAVQQRQQIEAVIAADKQKAGQELADATLQQLLDKNNFASEAFVAALTDKLIDAKNRELPSFIAKSTVEQRTAMLSLVEQRLLQAQTQVGKCNNDAESFVRQGRESEATASRSLVVALQAYQSVLKSIQEVLNQS